MRKILFYIAIATLALFQIGLIVSNRVENTTLKPTKPKLKLLPAVFSELKGFNSVNATKSLIAFQLSCRPFLKQDPETQVGSKFIPLRAKDWQPICKAAELVNTNSHKAVRKFFKTWFTPVEFYQGHPVKGLFTGYYMPLLKGNAQKTDYYSVPIYARPSNLITANLHEFSKKLTSHIAGRVNTHKFIPYYTRAEIDKGAIAKTSKVLAWVHHKLDRLTLEIEGSGVIGLKNGGFRVLGYAGENGAPYKSVPSIFIEQGIFNKNTASMKNIRAYFSANPEQVDKFMQQNESFVFFRKLPNNKVVGSQGIPLTPGYSLAVDRKYIPMGVPIWLETEASDPKAKFKRLMIAQDTGGAIRGPVRGDVYWGFGKKATFMANYMKSSGHYWLLLPKVALA